MGAGGDRQATVLRTHAVVLQLLPGTHQGNGHRGTTGGTLLDTVVNTVCKSAGGEKRQRETSTGEELPLQAAPLGQLR